MSLSFEGNLPPITKNKHKVIKSSVLSVIGQSYSNNTSLSEISSTVINLSLFAL